MRREEQFFILWYRQSRVIAVDDTITVELYSYSTRPRRESSGEARKSPEAQGRCPFSLRYQRRCVVKQHG